MKKRGFDQIIKEEDSTTDALSSSRSRSDSETGSTCSTWSEEEDDLHKNKRRKGNNSTAADRKKRRRRKWGPTEDKQLRTVVAELQRPGATASDPKVSWSAVAKRIPTRSAKQCRDRWNSITPGIRKREWTQEEDELLLRLYAKHKNSWVRIAKEFNGRNDNMLKSRFRALMKRIKAECNSQQQQQMMMMQQRQQQQQQQQQQQHSPHMMPMAPAHVYHQHQHPQLPPAMLHQHKSPAQVMQHQPPSPAVDALVPPMIPPPHSTLNNPSPVPQEQPQQQQPQQQQQQRQASSPMLSPQFQSERLSDNLFIMRSPAPSSTVSASSSFDASAAPSEVISQTSSPSQTQPVSAAAMNTSVTAPAPQTVPIMKTGAPRFVHPQSANGNWAGMRQASVNSVSGNGHGDEELADWCAFMVNEFE